MGRCELLRAVKFMQEEPGGVGVHLHQVEENPVERWTGVRWGARGGGGKMLVFYPGDYLRKKLIVTPNR